MKTLLIQHNDVEGPGYISDWIKQHHGSLKIVRPDQSDQLKRIRTEQFDLLVIMGGNESANEMDKAWINEERDLIRRAHQARKPIFGVCLGAQQLAKALGALVEKQNPAEIGWLPVQKSDQCSIDGIPDQLTVLHWHQDQFTLPVNSHRLFKSQLDVNQGFILDNMIGIQFHLEMKPDEVKKLTQADHQLIEASDAPNAVQQTAEQINQHPVPSDNQKVLFKLLDRITNQN